MIIKKSQNSRLNKVDFKNLSFGRYYSDHMLLCTYKENKWEEPIIKPFSNINLPPNSLIFHYGQCVFEGMKVFKDKKEKIYIFRPYENLKRINRSATRLNMPNISKDIFIEGLKNLVKLDEKWIPSLYGQSLYIRPFIIATGNLLIAAPSKEYLFIIICSPCDNYYTKALKVKIEQKYSRVAYNGGIGFTKAAGNYAASFYPTYLAQEEGYDQLLWTDSCTHEFIEESGTMNIFFYLKNNKLITPPVGDSILEGITRNSIIKLASLKNIQVLEQNIKVIDLINLLKKGDIIEVFGCGTAVVTNYFKLIGYNKKNYYLPNIPIKDRISVKLKKMLLDIQHNISKDFFEWNFKL